MIERESVRIGAVAAALALGVTLTLMLSTTATAFTRDFVRYTSSYQWARYGNYHSITYNSARVPTTSDAVCVAMITAAGNRRGDSNFCTSSGTFASVCFSY